jgi:hypothetical protein
MWKRNLLLIAVGLMLVFTVEACEKEKATEASKPEEVTVALTPANQEIKGEQFTLQFSDLKISKTIDRSTKELTSTPILRGTVKILNHSKNVLDVQGVTIQYLDKAGNPIPFRTGENKTTVSTYWTDLQPGKEATDNLNLTIPIAAVKDKSLDQIQLNVVYIPSPLKREVAKVAVKMEEK